MATADRSRSTLLVPILATKLTAPEPPSTLVHRARLDAIFDAGAPVTAVVAPAGYGKTVAVRDWVDHCSTEMRVAWVSLDALDRNPMSFWRHLVAALSRALPDLGSEPEQVLLERGADDPTFLGVLLHELSAQPDVVLVLDDLHLLDHPRALEHLALLSERASRGLRLVFTARADPLLPLPRWRSQGRLADIRAPDLRFGRDEAAELLGAVHQLRLDDSQLTRLVERTEGWATGLRLAALTLRSTDDATAVIDQLGRAPQLLTDYLLTEVLNHLPPEQREVVGALAVLDTFDITLATELTGHPETGAVVRSLGDSELFITRIGSSFRFHPLLRDLAEYELRTTDPHHFAELHRRAAALLTARGQLDAAFDHLRAIGDADGAFDLVVRPALRHFDLGRAPDVRRWLELFPGGLEISDPLRMLDFSFACLVGADLDHAEMWCRRAAEQLPSDHPALTARRLAIAAVRGDVETARSLDCGIVLDQPDEADDLSRRIDLVAARIHLLDDDVVAARRALEHYVPPEDDSVPARVALPALQARVLAAEGDVLTAHRLASQALAAANDLSSQNSAATFEAWLAEALALIGRGNLHQAAICVDQVSDHADRLLYPYAQAYADIVRLELHALERGWAATAGLADVLVPRWDRQRSTVLNQLLDERRGRAFAAAGRTSDALELAERLPPRPGRALVTATALLGAGRFDAVAVALDGHESWRPGRRVEATVVAALAATGQEAEAHLTHALELATPLGLVRPFLHGGADLDRLLVRLPEGLVEPLLGPVHATPEPRRPADRLPALTPREREVLALLPTHLSNAAIGDQLFVSVNTVKTILKAIYRKLGTASRAETVTTAQRLGLLPLADAR